MTEVSVAIDTFAGYLEAAMTGRYIGPVRARIASVVFDGRPIGETRIGVPLSARASQRWADQQWAAIVLVGTGYDRDVVNVETVAERDVSTPDFIVTFKDGREVLLEITQLCLPDERQYVGTLTRVAQRVAAELGRTGDLAGEYFVRFHDAVPDPRDTKAMVHELCAVIRSDPRLRAPYARVRVDVEYPTLRALDVYVARDVDAPGRVVVDYAGPRPPEDNMKALVGNFDACWGQKAAKMKRYATRRAGAEVWLGVHVVHSRTFAIGVVEELGARSDLPVLPFTRVLIGCPTAGVDIDAAGRRRAYSPMEELTSVLS